MIIVSRKSTIFPITKLSFGTPSKKKLKISKPGTNLDKNSKMKNFKTKNHKFSNVYKITLPIKY